METAAAAGALLLAPHRMIGRTLTASVPPTGRSRLVRYAPHEFYDGSAWDESGAPASTTAAAETAGTGRRPRRVRTAPHEFYDGSAWDESGTPASTTAAAETGTGRRPRHERAAPHEFFGGPAWAFQGGGGGGGGGGFGGAPASACAVAGLPQTTVVVGAADDDAGDCAVCLEEYVAGDTLRTLPCAHGFHEACIVDWLAVSHLCPLCRFKMPTQAEDDAAAAAAAGVAGAPEMR